MHASWDSEWFGCAEGHKRVNALVRLNFALLFCLFALVIVLLVRFLFVCFVCLFGYKVQNCTIYAGILGKVSGEIDVKKFKRLSL